MRQPERPDDADNPLRVAYAGPTPPEERHLEFERRFGLELRSGYAMSETPYGTVWAHGTRPYGTLGVPRQHPTLGRVNEARVSADGELELRNPAVMKGYWGMPEETERVLAPDGWLKTGDLVRENDDGTYTFVGRRKEVIRRRGENVAPAEIEEALASHPDVVEVAVVGVPSELSEEDIKAFVVMRDGADARFRRAARLGLGAAHRRSRSRACTRRSTSCPTPPRDGSRNIGSPHELSHLSGNLRRGQHHRHGPRPVQRADGRDHAHRARVPDGAAAAALPGGDAAPRRGPRLARRPRPHPDRARRAAHPHRRTRVAPGRRSPPAFWVPGASSWVSWRTRSASWTSSATTWPAAVARELEAGRRIPGLGHPVHKVRGPAHPADLRDRRGDRPGGAVSGQAEGGRGRRTGPRPAASFPSTARAWRARRSRTWASRRRSCAALRYWRGPRGCSVTSRKSCRALLGCVSTARWMSVRSMPRRLGSSGGVQATSEGRQAASAVPGGAVHASSPRALGPAECPCART